jgi:hypothetical protein
MLAVNHGYLAAYAREVPSLLERLAESVPPPPELSDLVSLFAEPSPAEEVSVAKGGACGFAVDFTSVDLSPDETNRQRVLDAINDNSLVCGTHSSGSILNARRRLVFLAKDEAAARTIQAALKQRALEVRFEAGVDVSKRDARHAFNEAMRSAAARAARAAKVELAGRRLTVTLALEPNGAEKQGMAELLDARAARARLAAEIVLGLADGKLPSVEQLDTFRTPAGSAK